VHIDDTLVYLLALVTVGVLMVGLAHALQGPPSSPAQRRRAMLASHRRSAGLLIGTFAPPPAEKLADLSPSPVAHEAWESVKVAPVADPPTAMPAEPITPLELEPALASAVSEPLPADAAIPVEAVEAPVIAADASTAADAPAPEESLPLDAVPALVALTVEFARPDAVVTLDALPEPVVAPEARSEPETLAVVEAPPEPVLAEVAAPVAVAAVAAPAALDVSEIGNVAQCLRAFEAGAHAAVGEAAARLARTRSSAKRARKSVAPPAPGEQVALWAILGLSRRALGETAGARAAFDSAARWLADVELANLPAGIVDAAPVLGRHLLLAGEDAGATPEMRHLTLRLAAACLEWGTAGGAAPEDVSALVARARDTFTAATEQRIVELIGRRDFTAAQRLVRETLGSPLVGDDRRDAFRDLVWTTLTAEVDRLVGEAREGRRADPLKGLAAATAVVAAIPANLLSASRREDLARRVWAGHLKLGLARAEQGDLDGAMAPLVHAVETAGVDPDRQGEACAALARTVGTLVERLSAESLTELRDGDLDAALAASRRLSEVLDQALERGLSPEDLRPALERRQDVLLSIAEGRPA
jgi:hypothetical protein